MDRWSTSAHSTSLRERDILVDRDDAALSVGLSVCVCAGGRCVGWEWADWGVRLYRRLTYF